MFILKAVSPSWRELAAPLWPPFRREPPGEPSTLPRIGLVDLLCAAHMESKTFCTSDRNDVSPASFNPTFYFYAELRAACLACSHLP